MNIIYLIGCLLLGCFIGLVLLNEYGGYFGKMFVGSIIDWIKRNNPFKIL